jgi:hypothetical protein
MASSAPPFQGNNLVEGVGPSAGLPDGTLSLTSGDADSGLLSPSDLASFEAQVSANLLNWATPSSALSLANGMLQLRDLGSTHDPTRFHDGKSSTNSSWFAFKTR